jgi:hypothetical protein
LRAAALARRPTMLRIDLRGDLAKLDAKLDETR